MQWRTAESADVALEREKVKTDQGSYDQIKKQCLYPFHLQDTDTLIQLPSVCICFRI